MKDFNVTYSFTVACRAEGRDDARRQSEKEFLDTLNHTRDVKSLFDVAIEEASE